MDEFDITIFTLNVEQLITKKYKSAENIKIELGTKLSKGVYLISINSETTSFKKNQ